MAVWIWMPRGTCTILNNNHYIKTDMEKIELKHLAPYLPYGLKVMMPTKQDSNEPWIEEMKSIYETRINIYRKKSVVFGEFKPILRPLFDLTEDDLRRLNNLHSESGKQSGPSDFTFWYGNTATLQDSINTLEWLYKNHYDVYGLIERGLAIDIKSLK